MIELALILLFLCACAFYAGFLISSERTAKEIRDAIEQIGRDLASPDKQTRETERK